MSREGSYAPKSPDLSSFYSTPAPVAAQHQPPQPGLPVYQQQNQRFLAPQQPYYQPPPQYAQPYISTQDQHQHQHQHQQPPSYCLQPPQQQQEPLQVYGVAQPPPPPPPPPSQYPNHQPFLPGYGGPQYPQPYGLPSSGYQQPGGFYPPPQPLLHEPATTPTTPQTPKTPSPPTMPPRKAAVAAAAALASSSSAAGAGTGAGAPPPPPPPTTAPPPLDASKIIAPSPVKTKFPTARIKRIMQADEEVGKVSQQTPIAVGKALELFMVALVTRSADVARTKNSKRVTAPMLKQVVETDDQWDFLRDIVKKVDPDEKHARGGSGSGGPGGPAGRSSMGGSGSGSGNGADGTAGSKTKLESDSEDEQPRKRGRPGRKKKV